MLSLCLRSKQAIKLCFLHSLWLSHILQGRFIILVRVMQKNLTDPWPCSLCATSAFFRERLGTGGTSDLGSLGCFGNVWSSLALFYFSPEFSFAVNSATEFPELFSGSNLKSITTSLPTTDSFISSFVSSCYLPRATLLLRDWDTGRERQERHVPTYRSRNDPSSQFSPGWLYHPWSLWDWSSGWWFHP